MYDAIPNLLEDALCGLLFNTMGYLHEHLKARHDPPCHNPAEFSEVPGEERLVTLQAHDDLHTDYDGRRPGKWEDLGGHGDGAL